MLPKLDACLMFTLALAPILSCAGTPSSSSEAAPSQQCRAPIVVPIRNVTIQGTAAVRRGAAISIGTPPQALAFEISPETNDTIVYDATNNTCISHPGTFNTKENSTFLQCVTSYGGLFNKSQSSTWSSAYTAEAIGLINPVTTVDPSDANKTYGTDTLRPDANISSIAAHPLVLSQGTTDSEGFFQNVLGLGGNSTMLNRLIADGSLTSNVWSMYEGWTGGASENQSDGVLVFGGYDKAKTSGDNATFKFNVNPAINNWSGWDVTVTDMSLKFRNGTIASLFAPNQIGGCRFGILPSYSYISVGGQIWNNFLSFTGSQQVIRSTSPLSHQQEIISTDTAYRGDLVMSMESGLQITIPNHELIKPYVDIDATGLENVQGSNFSLTPFYNLGSGQVCGGLGRAFLSSAYFMVDNDQKQFTLWQGRPSQQQNLVAVGQPSTCVQSTTTSATDSSGSPSSQISQGAIAGIIVASLLIAGLFIGIVFVLRRKRKSAMFNKVQNEQDHSSDFEQPKFQKAELSSLSDHQPPQELPPTEHSSNAVAPYELTGVQDWARRVSENQQLPVELSEEDSVSGGMIQMHNYPQTPQSKRPSVKK